MTKINNNNTAFNDWKYRKHRIRVPTLSDYQELKAAMIEAYPTMPDAYWKESHIKSLIDKFPEGQVVIKINMN